MVNFDTGEIRLLIVIVNHRSSGMVAKLVEQIGQQTLPKNTRTLVRCVDNSESSFEIASLENIRQHCLNNLSVDFELIISSSNCGYGSAINRATKGQTFDYLCGINPDVTLHENALECLVDHAKRNIEQGIWGILTVDDKSRPDYRHAWPEPTLSNTMSWTFGLNRLIQRPKLQDDYRYLYTSNHEKINKPHPVDNVSGCCFLISSKAWTSLKGFDSDFFLYSEEIDLCLRARRAGFQPTVVPSSKLQHKRHSYSESTERLPIIYKAKILYINKHHGVLYNLAYRACIFVGALNRILYALIKKQTPRARAWKRVMLDCLTVNHPNAKIKRSLDKDSL